jgi:hypothetical protein
VIHDDEQITTEVGDTTIAGKSVFSEIQPIEPIMLD